MGVQEGQNMLRGYTQRLAVESGIGYGSTRRSAIFKAFAKAFIFGVVGGLIFIWIML